MIRGVTLKDAEVLCNIYNYYIRNTTITFEEVPIIVEEMRSRIEKITSLSHWIVYESDGVVIGYAYATNWKTRSAYRFSMESTIYVDKNHQGKGVGTKLYTNLIELLKRDQKHSIIGVIALPNNGSIALHEQLGFRKVAHFKEVGYKHDKWIDVGCWQYNLRGNIGEVQLPT